MDSRQFPFFYPSAQGAFADPVALLHEPMMNLTNCTDLTDHRISFLSHCVLAYVFSSVLRRFAERQKEVPDNAFHESFLRRSAFLSGFPTHLLYRVPLSFLYWTGSQGLPFSADRTTGFLYGYIGRPFQLRNLRCCSASYVVRYETLRYDSLGGYTSKGCLGVSCFEYN